MFLFSARFELPLSNQLSVGNPNPQTVYQPAVLKNTQPRRPLEQVTCFKVLLGRTILLNTPLHFSSVEKRDTMPIWYVELLF